MFEQKLMEMFYAKAEKPEDLVWHNEEPFPMLTRVVSASGHKGRALDVGCGAGVFSVYLAEQGYEVTGLDFIPKALDMARARSMDRGVSVDWKHADLFEWRADAPFDLVLDSGCLHNFSGAKLERYKGQLLRWLSPAGVFVLAGFGKRHALDWRPIGPRRRSRRAIVDLFSPELREMDYERELMTDVPFPIGPRVLGQSFCFESAANGGTETSAERRES